MRDREDRVDRVWHDYWLETPDDPYLRAEASVVAERLADRFGFSGVETVFDFGCGYGYVAEQLAPRVSRVLIWDVVDTAAKTALDRINRPNVEIADPSRNPIGGVDVLLVNSVIQYMSPDTLKTWLRRWQSMLAEGGVIALADVPAKPPSLVREGLEWAWLSIRTGTLRPAMRFARANSGRYRSAKVTESLMTYSLADLQALAGSLLIVEAEPTNLAYQSTRHTYLIRVRVDV